MNKQIRIVCCLLLLWFISTPAAYASLESCRDPTPDEQYQLDLCSAHLGCRLVTSLISGCSSLTKFINKYFSPEKDHGNWPNDTSRNDEMGPSEREQARKDAERMKGIRSQREREARDAYLKITVKDKSLKDRIGKYCTNPLDSLCKMAIQDAETLVRQADAFNSNPDFVRERGKVSVISPGLAAPYAVVQEKAWNDLQQKIADIRSGVQSTEELKKKGEALKVQAENDRIETMRVQNIQKAQQERVAREKKRIEDERKAIAYQREEARRKEQQSRETRQAIGSLIGVIGAYQQGKYDRQQAAYEEQQRQLRLQREREAERRRAAQESERIYRYRAEQQRRSQEQYQQQQRLQRERQQQQFRIAEQRRVDEVNRRLREQAEQQRRINEQRRKEIEERRKWYAPLNCAFVSSKKSGNRTLPCLQNNCGRTIEAIHSGGMWSVGAGKCYSQFSNTVFYAACEKNNGYDRARGMCKR